MSPHKLSLQTIPEEEAMSPQQPDCLALLDVLQRDGVSLHGQFPAGWLSWQQYLASALQPWSDKL